MQFMSCHYSTSQQPSHDTALRNSAALHIGAHRVIPCLACTSYRCGPLHHTSHHCSTAHHTKSLQSASLLDSTSSHAIAIAAHHTSQLQPNPEQSTALLDGKSRHYNTLLAYVPEHCTPAQNSTAYITPHVNTRRHNTTRHRTTRQFTSRLHVIPLHRKSYLDFIYARAASRSRVSLGTFCPLRAGASICSMENS